MKTLVVVPWHNPKQLENFLKAWDTDESDTRILLQQDSNKEGCAVTKNKGIHRAVEAGADTVVILDDDCFPHPEAHSLARLIDEHHRCLDADTGNLFLTVTNPPSRGTPYFTTNHPTKRVAASMGYWSEIGDYDACAQLVRGATTPMEFHRKIVRNQFFPLCGMNLAFRPADWLPWCNFIDVPRFDDIWQGFLWQKEAYRRGYCFNLAGPLVRHSRQSNVWANLRDEAVHLERNETLWSDIANSPETEYDKLRALLPV